MATFRRINLLTSLAGCVFAAGLVSPPAVVADDIEVFFSSPVDATAKPNILFILDTSQSMFTLESAAPDEAYDPEKIYDKLAGCEPDAYYWTSGTGAVPSCATTGWAELSTTQFACPDWKVAVETGGFFTKISRIAQDTGSQWVGMSQFPSQQSLPTVCQGDSATPVGLNWSAKNKGKDVYPSLSYTVYDGNYLNWAAQSSGDKFRIDLIREAVGEVIANTEGIKVGMMRYGYDGSRVFEKNTPNSCIVEPNPIEDSRSSNGAPIIFPVTDLDGTKVEGFPLSKDVRPGETDVRSQLRYQLGIDANNSVIGWEVDPSLADDDQPFQIAKGGGGTCPIPLFTPGGRSPIAGGMYEAYLYFSGLQWSQKYGKQAALGSTFAYPSVEQSRLSGSEIYKSPISDTCAKNFIVLLSDGTTEQDNDVDGPVRQLPGFNTTVGKDCDADPYLDVTGTPPPSQCVDDMAEHMLDSDLRPNTAVPGVNNVITYTIGFKLGSDTNANAARQLLQETADRGGGEFYEAGNAVELKDKFGKIVREILTLNTSFSAPAVTVNAFNRTQNLNDLYMALFRPAFNYRWTGNIKKYQLDPLDGDILDADGKPAVDPGSGFFFNNARSFWSGAPDGADITAGGASGLIEYASRKVKTTSLLDGSTVNLNSTGLLTDAQLGIQVGDFVKPGVAASGLLTASTLIEWLYGKDVADEDADTITAESRYDMGDPLHAKPVTVIYGGTVADPDLEDDALFAITNDGVLHAFDPSSDSGEELWAFIPRDQLGRTRNLYYNRTLVDPEDRGYGIDGNIRVIRIDNNRNGIIETASPQNDKVYLYFGQRRGGQKYYAFDVSVKTQPRLMWSLDYTTERAGQAWSAPQPAKVRVGSTAMDVLIFGGGYDTTQDGATYAEDSVGIGIYMVDALDGDLIWRAGPDAGANLQITSMKHSIPGDVRVIDLTGDGFADRLYAADLGGRIWRFDIFNGNSATGTVEGSRLVEGGMLASLGNVEDGVSRDETNTIKFFYSPDPALITRPGPTFINVAIGSGNRELPATDKTVQNWFFSVRDYNVLTPLRSSWYKTSCALSDTPCHKTIVEGDLVDLTNVVGATATTSVPIGMSTGVAGWRIALEETGEKTLAESRTFQGDVFFTTYAPVERGSTDDECGIKFGLNKLYVVDAVDARPVYNYDAETGETVADRSRELAQGSIAPEVVFVFPTPPNVPASRPPPNCANIPGCDPDDPTTWPDVPGPAVPPVCLVGVENCGFGTTNPPVRTYWRQRGANN